MIFESALIKGNLRILNTTDNTNDNIIKTHNSQVWYIIAIIP